MAYINFSMNGISKKNVVSLISDDAFNKIVEIMEQVSAMSSDFKTRLRPMLFETTYFKGSHLLNAGGRQRIVWFILDGILQEISVDEFTFMAKTSWFWFKFNFVYAVPGFFDQEPSVVTINAVRDTKVVFIDHHDWKSLNDSFPEANRLTELIRTRYELDRKLHLKEHNELSTAERYLKHETEIDQLFQHVQLKCIAEYMGMSTDTFGKLRRKLIKRKRA